MATRKEVADRAGVSEATVSRVLNGVGPIREETGERVLRAARELNYHPSAIARSFARRKSGNIGIAMPYVPKVHLFSAYYFSEILSGIGEAARQTEYDLMLLLPSGSSGLSGAPGAEASGSADVPDYVSWFLRQKIDALLVLGASDHPEQLQALRKLQENGMPFCVVNQHYVGEGFDEVGADHEAGSCSAVKHLIESGFRGIAFLNGSPQYSNSRDRLAGYRRAMAEAGLPAGGELLFEGNYSRTSGYAAARAIAEARQKTGTDAVFAANDRMAIGLMQGLRELGLEPGRDLAITGYDDSDASRLSDPPLTSVHVPFFDMGRLAAEKLLQRLDGGPGGPSVSEKLETRLIIRRSSASKNQ